MLRALFLGLPALSFVLGVPLALKLVPPNDFYGFRTSTTLSSQQAWYQINLVTGLALMAAGIVAGLLTLALNYEIIALKPENRYIVGILLTAIIMTASMIPVVIYADRF